MKIEELIEKHNSSGIEGRERNPPLNYKNSISTKEGRAYIPQTDCRDDCYPNDCSNECIDCRL